MKCECQPGCATEIDGRLSDVSELALKSAQTRLPGLVTKRIKFSHITNVKGNIIDSFYSTKLMINYRNEATFLVDTSKT